MLEEYEKRCRETLARRLLNALIANGTLSEREGDDLRFPSEDALAEAEGQNDG